MDAPLDYSLLFLPPRDLPPAVAAMSVAFAFFVGSTIGSFLNVVIARVPHGQSVVQPRSRCPGCGAQISAVDNIPLLSWLLLRGKCRACGVRISARYPFVELLVGALAVALVLRDGYSLASAEVFYFFAVLVAISFIDIDTFSVPDALLWFLGVGGVGFSLVRFATGGLTGDVLLSRAIGGIVAFLALAAIIVVSTYVLRRVGRIAADETAMGWGDPLIFVGIGIFLGWELLPLTLFLASLQGSIVGLAMKATGGLVYDKPVTPGDDWIPPPGSVPFGPFLAMGAIQAAFFGPVIHAWLLPRLNLAGLFL